jgi:hypothetical protein
MSNEAVRFYPLDQWPGMADLPQTQDLTRQVTFPWSAPFRRRRNPVFDQRRRQSENQRSRDFESSYPRFPSIIGALIIAESILLSTLMFAAGTRFFAVETSNEYVAWLVDRLTGNLYKCRAVEQGKAACEAETATGSIGEKAKR